MGPSFGAVLKQAREVRDLSGVDAARAAGISAAYLSKLERDAVKKPSPHVLHQLSEALALPYTELMRLSGYRVPGESNEETNGTNATVGAALFADITEDEREELLEYLAWYRARRRWDRARRRSSRAVSDAGPDGS
jgi:transcriptional regulator with XRE-family HTH domain